MAYEFIKDRLKDIQRTQKDLADFLGIPAPHLSAILKGIRSIKASEIAPMAHFLELNLESFIKAISKSNKNNIRELLPQKTQNIYRVGFVEAGVWQEAMQLPENEWEFVLYSVNENLKHKHIFALGVRGESMNKIFPPKRTTLICCRINDYDKEIENGDFVIAQRISTDGKYEATVKRFQKIDDGTIILEAMSTDPRYTNIICSSQDDCEYQIKAIVIDYQTKLKDL